MADKLVTQVRNPDDHDDDNNSGRYANGQQAKKSRWQSLWASCTSCVSCLFCNKCCQQEQQEKIEMEPRQSMSTKNAPAGTKWLLPEKLPKDKNKKCLVLDLDETLVHSSFKPVPNADFVISIELEGEIHHVYVLKRPGVDAFLKACAEKWELIIFTASLAKYADPLLDILDPQRLVRTRLFREACVQHYGNYVKDLSLLGRELKEICILDNSPYSYIFQPDNALPISSWFNDPTDTQLTEILPILDAMAASDDITTVIANLHMYQPQTPPGLVTNSTPPLNPQAPPDDHSQLQQV